MSVARKPEGLKFLSGLSRILASGVFLSLLTPAAVMATPNGTWLSKPQIDFHLSSRTLDSALATIRSQQFRIVFLDYRNIDDASQKQVSTKVRQYSLLPVVWVQSPQYRRLTISQMIQEARYGDGIQVDDHFFTHYSLNDFYTLRAHYAKPIFCSIQPFQASRVPTSGCNQLDVQCYSADGLKNCLKLADRLNAVASLSAENTLGYLSHLGQRAFNVFLWPHSDRFFRSGS
jgi:hypothetical protein